MSHKFAIFFAVLALLLTACAGDGEQKRAEAVVDRYHKLYNEQNYEEIFNSAHEEARRLKSKEALGYALAKAFEENGRHLSSELVFAKVSPAPTNKSEKQFEFAYRSKFERGEVIETFLIVSDGRQAALHSIGKLTEEELEKIKK